MLAMIEFVVVDNEPKVLEYVHHDITSAMMESDLLYHIHTFQDFNPDFYKIVNKKSQNKIYILDIEVGSRSGIDISNEIRRFDLKSAIVFLSSHAEQAGIVSTETIQPLRFIHKFKNVHQEIKKTVKLALDMIGQKKGLYFTTNHTSYAFPLDEIIYITKENNAKYCQIHTDYTTAPYRTSLQNIMKELDDNFIQTHKSCIINKKHTVSINKGKKEIMFDNGKTIHQISDVYIDKNTQLH